MFIHKRNLALTQLILLLPALLFMAALQGRGLALLSAPAQSIVAWYAGRLWTLWLFLVLLPLAALLTGCLTLLGIWHTSTRQGPASFFLTALTLLAAVILAVVAVHVLMN